MDEARRELTDRGDLNAGLRRLEASLEEVAAETARVGTEMLARYAADHGEEAAARLVASTVKPVLEENRRKLLVLHREIQGPVRIRRSVPVPARPTCARPRERRATRTRTTTRGSLGGGDPPARPSSS